MQVGLSLAACFHLECLYLEGELAVGVVEFSVSDIASQIFLWGWVVDPKYGFVLVCVLGLFIYHCTDGTQAAYPLHRRVAGHLCCPRFYFNECAALNLSLSAGSLIGFGVGGAHSWVCLGRWRRCDRSIWSRSCVEILAMTLFYWGNLVGYRSPCALAKACVTEQTKWENTNEVLAVHLLLHPFSQQIFSECLFYARLRMFMELQPPKRNIPVEKYDYPSKHFI